MKELHLLHRFALVVIVLVGSQAFAQRKQPAVMTVAAFEAFKGQVKKDIEAELSEEFEEDEEAIATLAHPFETGTVVKICVIQGPRSRWLTGKFRGIKNGKVLLGEQQFNLSDVIEIDRERLLFANNKPALLLKIDQRRKVLNEKKLRRTKSERDKRYRAAGYTEEFFSDTVEMNGRYWSTSKLGHRKIHLQVTMSEHDDVVQIGLVNKSGNAFDFIGFLNKKGTFSTIELKERAPVLADKQWRRRTFSIRKADLAERPLDAILKRHLLWIVKKDVGSWYLQPIASGQPKTITRDDISCPECYGDKRVSNPDLTEGAAVAKQINCPSCHGKGSMETERYKVHRMKFTYNLRRKTIKAYSPAQLSRFSTEIDASAIYQNTIVESIEAVKAEYRDGRLEKADQRLARIREIEDYRATQIAAVENLEKVDEAIKWLEPNDSKVAANASTMGDRQLQAQYTDPASYPRRLEFDDEIVPIEKCSEWMKSKTGEKIKTKYYELSNVSYRVLKKGIPLDASSPKKQDDRSIMNRDMNNMNNGMRNGPPGMPDRRNQSMQGSVSRIRYTDRPGRQNMTTMGVSQAIEGDEEEEKEEEEVDLEEMTLDELNAVELEDIKLDLPRYFLQYQVALAYNHQTSRLKIRPTISVLFEDDTEIRIQDMFAVEPAWFGHLLGVKELDLVKQIGVGIRDVLVVPPNKPMKEPPKPEMMEPPKRTTPAKGQPPKKKKKKRKW
jgi:hypothetical protein